MNPANESSNGQSQPLRLNFDSGTLVVEGLATDQESTLPGVRFDLRTRQFRAKRSGTVPSSSICGSRNWITPTLRGPISHLRGSSRSPRTRFLTRSRA